MNYLTNLVQFPGLGLSFQLNRVAFTIGGISIYWYGVCIAVGLCLALIFAFRHSLEFGVDPDSMVTSSSSAWCWASSAPAPIMWLWHLLNTRASGR